jgi:hypothetical protein
MGYQSVMSQRQGTGSSGVGFAFALATIKELLPDQNICLAEDKQSGVQYQLGLDKRGILAWPQVNDTWIVDRSLGHWALRCKVTGTSPPAVTGSRSVFPPGFIALLGVLDGLGLIDDQTTSPLVPVGVWASAVYTSPWADFSGAYRGARYMLDYSGFVVIEGAVKTTTTISAGTSAVFTLPPGYRPLKTIPFSQISGTAVREMEVTDAGVVQFTGMPNATVGLTSITCRFSLL